MPPVNAPRAISEWTTDDLSSFIRNHLQSQAVETRTTGIIAESVEIHEGLTLHAPIAFRTMDAPIVVSSPNGPGLQNGFVDGASPNPPVQFYKDPFGWVHLHGSTANTGGTVGLTIFTLPPGFRPDAQAICMIPTDSNSQAFAQLIIGSDGTVKIGSGTRTAAYLSGVKFPISSNQ